MGRFAAIGTLGTRAAPMANPPATGIYSAGGMAMGRGVARTRAAALLRTSGATNPETTSTKRIRSS